MGDFLGTGTIAPHLMKYRSFEDAREFVRSLKLKSQSEWFMYCIGELPEKGNKPDDIPRNVYASYKTKGWVSWPDFLGYEPMWKKK